MRTHRVHVATALAAGALVEVRGAAATHVTRVLRLRPGDALTLFNGDGSDYHGRIQAPGRNSVMVEVQGVAAARAESPLVITLVQGIARGDRMDLVVQKATELGVAAIQPVLTARSVVRLDAAGREKRLEHWRGVVIAACEQCGRARLPAIAALLPLPDWLARPAGSALRLQLDPESGEPLAGAARGADAIELLVGPEGGLEDGERALARRCGYRSARLGPRVLRSETAAIAALAVVQAAAGDLA